MVWARLDDQFPDHPKIVDLSSDAFRLHVAAICYSARLLTDGAIPKGDVARLTRGFKPRHLAELEAAGLWDQTPAGFALHDFLDFNPTREKVMEERAATTERKRRWQEKNTDRNASADATRTRRGTVPRPDPTRPEGSRGGSQLQSIADDSPAPSGGESPDEEPAIRTPQPVPDSVRAALKKEPA